MHCSAAKLHCRAAVILHCLHIHCTVTLTQNCKKKCIEIFLCHVTFKFCQHSAVYCALNQLLWISLHISLHCIRHCTESRFHFTALITSAHLTASNTTLPSEKFFTVMCCSVYNVVNNSALNTHFVSCTQYSTKLATLYWVVWLSEARYLRYTVLYSDILRLVKARYTEIYSTQ